MLQNYGRPLLVEWIVPAFVVNLLLMIYTRLCEVPSGQELENALQRTESRIEQQTERQIRLWGRRNKTSSEVRVIQDGHPHDIEELYRNRHIAHYGKQGSAAHTSSDASTPATVGVPLDFSDVAQGLNEDVPLARTYDEVPAHYAATRGPLAGDTPRRTYTEADLLRMRDNPPAPFGDVETGPLLRPIEERRP